MIKYLLIFFILTFVSTYSQDLDTLSVVSDSLIVDTLKVSSRDSLLISDSLKVDTVTVKPDTLAPIQISPLTEISHIIDKRNFLFYNYRYAGDFLRSFPLNFVKDLAFIGQPHETFIYGAGNGGISFMEDGVLWNNRFTNSLDLNHDQSEDIDSVEIVPSPRGFLYGPYNNPVTVNFIMRDFISPEPYTRIRYYEGPFSEAMIDVKFNAQVAKRWNLSFQVANRGADDRYINSEYSLWQANAKLKYFLYNSVNLTALYSYVDSEVGLNGGVDVDSIANLTGDINSVLYDNQFAPVVYPNRYQSVLNHNFGLRMQALPFDDAKADWSFYYKYGSDKVTNDLDTIVVRDKFENKIFGSTISYKQKVGIFSAQIYGNFEKNSLTTTYENDEVTTKATEFKYISVGGVLSANLFSGEFVPSIFYKYYNQNYTEFGKNYMNSNSGFGTDIYYKPLKNLALYAGYSIYNQFNFGDAKNFEVSAKYTTNNLFADLRYFDRKNFVPYSISIPHWTGIEIGLPSLDISGVGLLLNYKFWKLLIETNTSHYFNSEGYQSYSLPELQFTGGLYLNDMFFENNLYLKAGIIFYYTGALQSLANKIGIVEVEPSNKVDFSLAGEIKKVAIVYFIWENLLGNQYFITTYYPMPERNIRFGLSWELFN